MTTTSADIRWAVYLTDTPDRVYRFLSTDEGRARFWAERTIESGGTISFEFPSGDTHDAVIISDDPPKRFVLDYFGSPVSFELRRIGRRETILEMTHRDVYQSDRCEMMAGWVSVLMALKAAVNFSVDLRNHDPDRSWDTDFVGN